MKNETMKDLEQTGIIAIVRGLQTDKILPFAEALYAGGIRLIEVTFNQSDRDSWADTCRAVGQIRGELGDKMNVGAGTVLTQEQALLACEAGAEFIVSPNTDRRVIEKTRELGMRSFPGAFTATEIEAAYEYGADAVKVFPASVVGPGYFKALKAPLSHIPLLAVGGINETNIADYLKAGAAGAGVGGNLTREEYIRNNDFDRITDIAASYSRIIREFRR